MTGTAAVTVVLLADDAPRNTGPDFGKASPVGLLIIVLLTIGTFALIWSMNRHLKRLPDRFDRKHPEPDQAAHGALDDTDGESADSTEDPEGSGHDPGG
jgi:hypothetical protein